MDAAVLIARLILAAVLAAAGLAKLLRPSASREAMAAFGVSASLAPVAAVAVPVAEIVVAVTLVPASTSETAAAVAFLMLAAFTVAVGVNLARGRAPACGCIGAVSAEPIGPGTIVRNLVLMGLAAFVVAGEQAGAGVSLGRWFAGLSTGGKAGALFGVALVVAIAIPVLVARSDPSPTAPEEDDEEWGGLPVGQEAPAFRLREVRGTDVVSLASLLAAGRPVLLVFAAPNCRSCAALLPDVAAWERDLGGELTVAVVSANADDGAEKAREHGLGVVLADDDRIVADAYRTIGTPAAAVVGVDGRISTDTAHGPEEIHRLMDRELWKVVPPVTG